MAKIAAGGREPVERPASSSVLTPRSSNTASTTRSASRPRPRSSVGDDPRERRVALLGVEPALGDRALEVAGDPLPAGLGARERPARRASTCLADRRVDLGDAVAHQAGAGDEDPLDRHRSASVAPPVMTAAGPRQPAHERPRRAARTTAPSAATPPTRGTRRRTRSRRRRRRGPPARARTTGRGTRSSSRRREPRSVSSTRDDRERDAAPGTGTRSPLAKTAVPSEHARPGSATSAEDRQPERGDPTQRGARAGAAPDLVGQLDEDDAQRDDDQRVQRRAAGPAPSRPTSAWRGAGGTRGTPAMPHVPARMRSPGRTPAGWISRPRGGRARSASRRRATGAVSGTSRRQDGRRRRQTAAATSQTARRSRRREDRLAEERARWRDRGRAPATRR